MPDNIDSVNPNRHVCGCCRRGFVTSNPYMLDGLPVCTLCLVDMEQGDDLRDTRQLWDEWKNSRNTWSNLFVMERG